jgi:endonuclease YncB( thermonuclease family)
MRKETVSAGWAWSFGRNGDRYELEERRAVARRLGVHGHRCVPPSAWRSRQRDRNGE